MFNSMDLRKYNHLGNERNRQYNNTKDIWKELSLIIGNQEFNEQMKDTHYIVLLENVLGEAM